jgi:adhesin transport system outer membrane protein
LSIRATWLGVIAGLLFSGAALAQNANESELASALQATLRNHPALAGQLAKVEARRFAADGVRSQRYPTVSAQAQQYAQGDRSVTGEDLSQPAIFRLRQPVWSFGRIKHNIAVANIEVSVEQADLLQLRRQLLEAAATSYALVHGNAQSIDVARENVTAHELLLAQIQRRVQGQLASNVDERLAATRLVQARSHLQRAHNQLETAREDLRALTQTRIDAAEAVPAALIELPDGLIGIALEQSAELRVKQQQLDLAEAEVKRTKTASMPTIYFQADRLHDQPALVDDNQVSVVFEASLDGLGFASRGYRGEASASRRAAQRDLEATRIEVRRALDSLVRKRRLEAELIELQTGGLDDLKSLLDSYRRQYASGTKSWLDVMNLQREFYEQSVQLVRARMDYVIYSLQLQARTGGLDGVAGLPLFD